MDLRIDSTLARGVDGVTESRERLIEKASGESPAADFGQTLGKAIGEIDRMQVAADNQANAVAHGAGNLHEMTIALEKADVAMRLAMRVRNKLVETYNDIMRMGM
jgi:flagellar hook-basal body complex protein FliE